MSKGTRTAVRRAPAQQARRARRSGWLGSLAHPSLLVFKVLLPILILCALGGGIVYVRLLNGPISLKFLAAPIARSIAAEMPGVTVAIDDALVRLTDSGGFEFRMRNVRFNDSDGAPIALAPLAAVGMSTAALWSARLAPEKVVLIEPRLLLSYTEANGLSVKFAKPVSVGDAALSPSEPAANPVGAAPVAGQDKADDDDAVSVLQRVDIARLIATTAQRARRGADAASFLRQLGVRNATVILDRSGWQTVWTVIEGDIDLEHKKKRSTVAGALTMASASGPWTLGFKIDEAEKTRSVSFEATVQDLVPKGLAAMVPDVAVLGMLDAPFSGRARLDLTLDGQVTGGGASFDIGQGTLAVGDDSGSSVALRNGKLDLRYDASSRRMVIAPSKFVWDQGDVTLGGSVVAIDAGNGGQQWAFSLRSVDGSLSGAEFGVADQPIREAAVDGTYDPDSGAVSIALARLKVADATVEAEGTIASRGDSRDVSLTGRFSPTSAEVAKVVWPRLLAPGARRWTGRQVTKGRIASGNFKVMLKGQRGDANPDNRRISLTLEAADVAFVPAKALAPIEAPRALLRLEGDGLEISIPDAVAQVGANRRLAIKSGRMTAVAIYDEPTQGEVAFRVQAPLSAAIDYIEQEGLGIGSLGLPAEGVDGKFDGQFKIALPLVTGVQMSDMKLEGKARISDGRIKQAIGHHDIQGATVTIDVGDGAVNAAGQMLVGGVNAKLSFQRFLGATDDRQPPIRLTGTLDAADRNQLGFDINHLVAGDIPVDGLITRDAKGDRQIHVRADLTGNELTIEPLAWRKTPGRQALLEFDIVKVPQKNRTELQGFKLVGDDIAIDGNLAFDGKGRLIDFSFPNFSLTLVSRLELQGNLRGDNVWDVKAKGQYWDGREFFRQLFTIGQAPDRETPAKRQAGLDLKADLETVRGQSDISLKSLRLQLSKRQGLMTGLLARAVVEGGKPIEMGLQQASNEPRKLVVLTDDAGQAFRLVGFYPNLQGGQMRLDINLDGKGAAEKTGMLDVRNFRILGDAVVSEVLQTPDEARANAEAGRRPGRRVERQSIEFNLMQAPFSVGYNQFVLEDAQLRGPLLGASLRGKADLKTQFVDIGGSYIPLQGLNAALGELPALGQVLAGPKGEGVLGITFRIVGPMAQPQVVVNPLSLIAPGIFRGMFEMTTQNPRVVPRDEKPAAAKSRPKVQAPAGGAPVRQPAARAPAIAPEVSGGWSTNMTGSRN